MNPFRAVLPKQVHFSFSRLARFTPFEKLDPCCRWVNLAEIGFADFYLKLQLANTPFYLKADVSTVRTAPTGSKIVKVRFPSLPDL